LSYKKYQKGYVERYLELNGIDYNVVDVRTEDGYMIKMHNLPAVAGTGDGSKGKGTILFLHGMFESSSMTLTSGLSSLPLKLQSLGYNVFLGNVRGNIYGLNHETMSPWDDEFWDFSILEHGRYDFSAMIRTILDVTGEGSIASVYGTSQGSLITLLGLSYNPALNSVIRSVVAVSPALILRKPTNPLVNWVFNSDPRLLGRKHYFSFASFTQIFIPDSIATFFAYKALQISGMCVLPINESGSEAVMASTPSGFLPTHSMLQYISILERGSDYYNGKERSACDINNCTVPIAVYMGSEDCVLDVTESIRLLKDVYGGRVVKEVVYDGWSHTDLWYSNESYRLADDVVRLIEGGFCEGGSGGGGGGGGGGGDIKERKEEREEREEREEEKMEKSVRRRSKSRNRKNK
jgi:lysosomal acid lipase/cholesteryl ester hydrolase